MNNIKEDMKELTDIAGGKDKMGKFLQILHKMKKEFPGFTNAGILHMLLDHIKGKTNTII